MMVRADGIHGRGFRRWSRPAVRGRQYLSRPRRRRRATWFFSSIGTQPQCCARSPTHIQHTSTPLDLPFQSPLHHPSLHLPRRLQGATKVPHHTLPPCLFRPKFLLFFTSPFPQSAFQWIFPTVSPSTQPRPPAAAAAPMFPLRELQLCIVS